MSVINRMLSDLEGRGARSPEQGVSATAPGQTPTRKRPLWVYAAPLALALALVAVAAALLYQRWPQLVALWSSPPPLGATPSEQKPADPGAGDPTPSEQKSADPGARDPRSSKPALAKLAFATDDGAVELRLKTTAEPGAPPAYEREGPSVRIELPVAEAPGTSLPAPPAGQDLVRALRLETTGQRPTLHLRVAGDARIDVAHDAAGYLVTARAATTRNASAEATDGGADDSTAGADESTAAEASGDAANGAGAASDESSDGGQRANPEAERTMERDATAQTESASAATGDEDSDAGPSDTDGDSAASESGDASQASADASEAEAPAGDAPASDAAVDDEAIVRESGESEASVRAQRRYRSARQALGNGELAPARTELRAALEADPDLHAARDLLVTLLRRAEASDAAREVLATGLERAPERRAYAEPMARLLIEAGELERAAEILEGAAPAGGGEPSYHALRAAVAQRLERHEAAISAYTRALEGDGGRGRWWLGLGISLAAAGHPSEARSAFREARATGELSERLDRWAQQRMEALASSAGE